MSPARLRPREPVPYSGKQGLMRLRRRGVLGPDFRRIAKRRDGGQA